MRVKVGDQWFECSADTPIMVELTEVDKRNIANMHPNASRYALFDDGCPWSNEIKEMWMDAGARSAKGYGV